MVSVIGTNPEVIRLRADDKLRDSLGFVNIAELKGFINSRFFEPYFDQYAKVCIYPQQARAFRSNNSRTRGPGLQTVERRLLQGEQSGDNKFSCPIPDKAGWDNIDHCAYMMYGLRESNRNNVQGIFYNKGLDESQMHNRLWALIRYAEYNQAPSKKKDPRKYLPRKRLLPSLTEPS